jgi:hypothetical protein
MMPHTARRRNTAQLIDFGLHPALGIVQKISTERELRGLEHTWDDILTRSRADNVFFTWDWTVQVAASWARQTVEGNTAERSTHTRPRFNHCLPQLSVGTLLHACTIEMSITKGLTEFDFTRGAEPFKSRWPTEVRNNFKVQMIGQNSNGNVPNVSGS